VLPIALVAFAIGSALVKNLTTTGAAPFDGLSVVLSALAFGGIVYGLGSLGHSAEGSGVPVWIPLAVGVVALIVFVLRQLSRQEDGRALLDMRPFLTPTFSIGLAMLAISMMALFGALILLPLYLQNVLGLDTLKTGLLLLPGGLFMGILAPFVGRVFDRVGPRPLVIPGVVVVSGALWLMTLLGTETSLPVVVGIHSMLMIGLALVMTPLMTSSLGSVPSELYSHGSAIFNTGQQLAGAAGTALFVTIMSNTAASRLADGSTDIAAQQSGIHTAFVWGGVISLIAVAGSFFIRKPAVTS
jgi:DHA2 family lincomycin resistance protein-like MFS transporter